MIGISEKEQTFTNETTGYDFDLGIVGFKYSDLYDAEKLKELAEKFYAEVEEKNPLLHEALIKYINSRGEGYESRVESKILTDAAPHLSEFVARMFSVNREREELQREIQEQDPIWKYKFFVQRRATKKFKEQDLADFNENELTLALQELRNTAFSEVLIHDEELAVADITVKLLEAEEILTKNLDLSLSVQTTLDKINTAFDKLKDKTFGKVFMRFVNESKATGEFLKVEAVLNILEAWSAIQFFGRKKKWESFRVSTLR